MRITIVAVGRLKERYWKEAAEEYLRRLRPYADVRVVEVPDRDESLGIPRVLAEEARGIEKAIPDGAYTVLVDRVGRPRTSEQLAEHLQRLGVEGRGSVAFVLGGSHGVDKSVSAAADDTLSLGQITLPHNLARVVVLEQVYRAFKIAKNEPYHK